LLCAQHASLRLDEHDGLTTPKAAAAFVAHVGIALRYGPGKGLPIASLYAAVQRSIPDREPEAEMQRRATVLTHALIDDGIAIETNVVADRVAIAHR
jgi:hypothetical protein